MTDRSPYVLTSAAVTVTAVLGWIGTATGTRDGRGRAPGGVDGRPRPALLGAGPPGRRRAGALRAWTAFAAALTASIARRDEA